MKIRLEFSKQIESKLKSLDKMKFNKEKIMIEISRKYGVKRAEEIFKRNINVLRETIEDMEIELIVFNI